MKGQLDFSLTVHYVVCILRTFALTSGQGDSICQDVVLTESQGTITSPNYPSVYPSNLNCTWTINVTLDDCRSIEIHIVDFDLQNRSSTGKCFYNFQIYDNIRKEQLTRFACRQEPLGTLVRTSPSTSHSVVIRMISDGTIEGRGFNVTYKPVQSREDYLMFIDAKGTIVVEEQYCLYSSWSLYNNTDQRIAAVEFDPSERIFYISDTNRMVISRYELIGWKEGLRFKDDIVTKRIENVTSLAVDSVNKRLYWTDSNLNSISTSRLNGSQRTDLFTSDLVAPSNILLGPDCRYIYWTCTGTDSSTIERAFVNGTSREKAESERGQGPFVLAIKGPILYRIKTLTGTLRQYDLRNTFLTRASDRDDQHELLYNTTSSVITTDGALYWSANTKTYYWQLTGGKVYDLPDAPRTSQLLHYRAKDTPSVPVCPTFDEMPLEITTSEHITKASPSTETSQQLKTSLSTYVTNSPKRTEAEITTIDRNTKASPSTEKSEQLKTSLSKYITNTTKTTVVTTLFPYKDAKSVISIPTSHPNNLQIWHVLLLLVVGMIVCVGLVLASVKYKRSTSRSFHLHYPDKVTFKLLLEKQPPPFSTTV